MIGWIANVFILLGIGMIAYKKRSGFIMGTIGNTLWCVKGFQTGQVDLITIEMIIVVLQLFSYINWKRQDERGRATNTRL